MKKNVVLLLTVFIFSSSCYAQNLSVATYNIRYKNKNDSLSGNGWERRCPVITGMIHFHDFDILGAQEVLYVQLNDMLKLLPEYSYIGVGRNDGLNDGEFAPILYKKEMLLLLQSGHFWLSDITDKPNVGWDAALPRICTWGKFQIKENGKIFWFYNLHMDHVGVNARIESSKLVIQKIKEMCKDEPVILTGDFNVDQTSMGYQFLCNSGIVTDAYETTKIRYALNGTINRFNPNMKSNSRIDHIFVSKHFEVERYGILSDSYWSEADSSAFEIKSSNFPKEVSLHHYVNRIPSDHYPVQVKVKFTK